MMGRLHLLGPLVRLVEICVHRDWKLGHQVGRNAGKRSCPSMWWRNGISIGSQSKNSDALKPLFVPAIENMATGGGLEEVFASLSGVGGNESSVEPRSWLGSTRG